MRRFVVVAVVVAAGCSKSRPTLKAEHLPAPLAAYSLGTTTEAQLLAAFPTAKATEGSYDNVATHTITVPDAHLEFVVAPPSAEGTLIRMSYTGADACSTVAAIDKLDGSTNCPGNRKTGNGTYYCMSAADGTLVTVDCSKGDQQSSIAFRYKK